MPNPYGDQVEAAIRAVTIRSATRYTWLGRSRRPLARAVEAALDESERRRYLVSCLQEDLYASFYCHGGPVPARWGESQPLGADPGLTRALSDANTGRGSWETGWTVLRVDGAEVVAATPDMRMRVAAGDCRGLDARPGAPVDVRLPKELPALSPGFYTAVGDAATDPASWPSVVRAYWNVTSAGAHILMHALTSRLNADGTPFRLKVADHPFRFGRCDVAVLYLPGDAFGATRDALRAIAAALTTHLRPRTPAFTLELAPGVALAEDDGAGESFGVRRCALLADAIVSAHDLGIVRHRPRLDAVTARFAEDGVQIDAPYLEPALAGRHVL